MSAVSGFSIVRRLGQDESAVAAMKPAVDAQVKLLLTNEKDWLGTVIEWIGSLFGYVASGSITDVRNRVHLLVSRCLQDSNIDVNTPEVHHLQDALEKRAKKVNAQSSLLIESVVQIAHNALSKSIEETKRVEKGISSVYESGMRSYNNALVNSVQQELQLILKEPPENMETRLLKLEETLQGAYVAPGCSVSKYQQDLKTMALARALNTCPVIDQAVQTQLNQWVTGPIQKSPVDAKPAVVSNATDLGSVRADRSLQGWFGRKVQVGVLVGSLALGAYCVCYASELSAAGQATLDATQSVASSYWDFTKAATVSWQEYVSSAWGISEVFNRNVTQNLSNTSDAFNFTNVTDLTHLNSTLNHSINETENVSVPLVAELLENASVVPENASVDALAVCEKQKAAIQADKSVTNTILGGTAMVLWVLLNLKG